MGRPRINQAAYDALPPDQKREADRLLLELREIWEQNPLERFDPHPKQAVFMASDARIKAFFGGNGSGKTVCGVLDDLIQAVPVDWVPAHLKPFRHWPDQPFKCRIVTPDLSQTLDEMLDRLRAWVPLGTLAGGTWDKAYAKQDRILRFKHGSQFDFMSFEQDEQKHGSVERDRIHYDEEPPEGIRNENRARLRASNGDELFTMTPQHGMTWMFDKVYERRLDTGFHVVEVDTDDNPHISQEWKTSFFASLSDEERDARKKGRFVAFGGLVLGDREFTDDQIIEPPAPAHIQQLDVLVGIDPGMSRGGVVWVGFDRDDSAVVFDELYPSNQDLDEIAQDIHDRNRLWGLEGDREPLYVIDPSARNRGLMDKAVNIETELLRFGIPTTPGQNARRAGVFQMKRRCKANTLLVSRECFWWLWERKRWRVEQDELTAQDKARGDAQPEFKTAGPDHLMDPTRYCLMERPWGPLFSDETPVKHRKLGEAWPPPRRETPAPPTGAFT